MVALSKRASSTLAVQVLMVLGVSLFSSAKWTALAGTAENTMAIIYIARFAGLATYAACAVLFRKRTPSLGNVFAITIPFMLLYLVFSSAAPVFFSSELGNVVLQTTSILYGISCSLLTIFCAYVFSLFPPRQSAVLFISAELATSVFSLILSSLTPDYLLVGRNLFMLAGTGIFLYAWRCVDGEGKSGSRIRLDVEQPETSEQKAVHSFPASVIDWTLLLVAAAVFDSLFGVIAQVSSMEENSFALYDIGTTVIVIAFEILLLVYLCFQGDKFGFAEVLVAVTVLFATGYALYSYAWTMGGLFAGAIIRVGFAFGSVLMKILVARKSYYNPKRAFFYFGLYFSFASVYPGRAVGSLLTAGSVNLTELCIGVSLVALWIICIFGIIVFYVVCKSSITSLVKLRLLPPLSSVDYANTDIDAVAYPERLAELSARLQLTQREEEVLIEALRGYSRTRIAEKLCLSPETVKSHLGKIYLKAGVNSRQALIALVEKELHP